MADGSSPLLFLQNLFGVGGYDGVSGETKRALIKEGVIPAPQETQPATGEQAVTPIGGPSPSQELLDRVKAQQEKRAADSLKLLLERRRQQGY